MNLLTRLFSILALLVLAACGGGSGGGSPFGGDAGSGSGGGGGSTGSGTNAADLVVTLSAATIANVSGATATATVTAIDANRNAVAGVPVTLSVDANAVLTPSGTKTDDKGQLTAVVGIGSDTSTRTITVTATSGSITRTAALQVQPSSTTSGQVALTVSLSSSLVTSASPTTVTTTLKDAGGAPIPNTVVTLSTQRGNLAVLSSTSLLTNAQGVASTTLRSAASGVDGADQVIGTATVGTATVQGQAGFTVSAADTPTLSVTPSNATLRFSTSPLSISAKVLGPTGAPVANQVVTFSAKNGLVRFDAASVVTSATGDAVAVVRPVSASSSGVEVVTVATTVGGRDLQASTTIALTAEAPAISMSISNSAVTATNPPLVRAVVKDLAGNLLPNAIVTFSSQGGLTVLSPTSQVTNSLGEATAVVSPKTATSAGADTIVASVTVQGITATAQVLAQVAGSVPSGTPTLDLALNSTSISSASPATVTATLRDSQGQGVAGQVVTFAVVRGLATTNVTTQLTNTAGQAVVRLSPSNSASAGADEISASATYAGVQLQRTLGFQVQATPVTLDSLVATANPLSAYGQTDVTLTLTGASVTSPVNISVSSSCVSQGKATLSPSTFTATSSVITMQYRDNGCGAVQSSDQLQAVVTSTGASKALTLNIQPPAESSIAFIQASPEQIYLRGSGFTESSIVTFEVRDAAGNPLPNRAVELRLQTGAGGVTMEGHGVESVNPPSANPVTLTSNAQGRVSVRVNSGTLPTPVRIHARLAGNSAIATVSSNLSVAVGLPSQLNFSFSQGTRNIEGYNIDGTPNTYQVIAADRSGNPVPAGTSINFITEGGQVEAIKQTQIVSGISRTVANFVSAEPRPVDGRITVTAYALGEESFIDLNGNNAYDAGEPFQDLGNIFKDRNFDGSYDPATDEYIPLEINNTQSCYSSGNTLLALDPSIPSVPGTCDGIWSGAGQVYVRRATETVLSTSAARPLWADTSGLSTCSRVRLQVGPAPSNQRNYAAVAGDTWYTNGAGSGLLNFVVADANPGLPLSPFVDPLTDYTLFPRLNPVAAGSTVTVTTTTPGFTVTVSGGSPVPSTTSASLAAVLFTFTDSTLNGGIGRVVLTVTSPSGVATAVGFTINTQNRPSSSCVVP